MIKTSSIKSAESRKGIVGVGDDRKVRRDGGKLDGSGIDNVEVDGGKVGDDEVGKKGWKTSKNSSKSKKTVRSDFFTLKARLVFTKLRQTFVKASILHHFGLKCHIRVQTDASGYTIGEVFS